MHLSFHGSALQGSAGIVHCFFLAMGTPFTGSSEKGSINLLFE